MEEPIRILIVDDIESHRRRFQRILTAYEAFEVVGLAASGKEAVALALETRPDIVLMDIEMETRTAGIDASAQILDHFPQVKIIILTVHKDDHLIFQSYQTGVVDYILKSEEPEIVVQGIRTAYHSHSPIRGDIAESIRSEFKRIKETESSMLYILGTLPQLTYSEQQVLKLLCQNKTRREIAEERFVELDTIKKQTTSILRKFKVNSTAEIVAIMQELKIVDLLP